MLALVKTGPGPGLALETVPDPVVGINHVLIRVLKTGICGTDLHIAAWDPWAAKTIVPPLIVGHEFVGEVVEVGANVSGFAVGDLVSGEGHVVCGRCRHCLAGRRELCANTVGLGVARSGAFAEYVVLPMTNVWHHWPGIDVEVAAVFDPFGNAVHTALDGTRGHDPYAPCSLQGLRDRGYEYWALGHVHQRAVLSQDPWVVFPGKLQGRHAREIGEKGATLIEVGDEGDGVVGNFGGPVVGRIEHGDPSPRGGIDIDVSVADTALLDDAATHQLVDDCSRNGVCTAAIEQCVLFGKFGWIV